MRSKLAKSKHWHYNVSMIEDLARVHSLVGPNVGVKTPEEIAVCIVGEMIQTRASRR
jgi:xanthine/CO dehydrogenase XdhC/CoxF family maturation factor